MKLIKLNELFDIKYGNSFELINLAECENTDLESVNYVSRTEKNNGVSAVVKKMPGTEPFPSGLITVAGSGNSVLESFIQPKEFYTWFHVFVLQPLHEMSELEKLFYCYCIRLNQYKYNYWRQANKTLKHILVPEKMPDEWKNVATEGVKKLIKEPLLKEESIINTDEWGWFNLNDLFDISASRDKLSDDLTEGGHTPYVTSSEINNGITSFFEEAPTNKAGTITANRWGSVGYFFYQPVDTRATSMAFILL